MRRLAAVGAWLQAALLLEMLLTVLVLLPARAGITPDRLEDVYTDPAKYLAFVNEHGFLRWMLDPDLPFAIVCFFTVWGVGAHLHEKSRELSWVATAVGVVSSAFFLGVGMIELVSVPNLVRMHLQNPNAAAAGYYGLNALWEGIAAGALFANGVWIVIVGIAGYRGGSLPKPLCYLGIVPAIGAFFYFIVPPMQFWRALFTRFGPYGWVSFSGKHNHLRNPDYWIFVSESTRAQH